MVSLIGPEVLSIQLFLILLHTLYIKNVFRNPKAKQSIYSDTDPLNIKKTKKKVSQCRSEPSLLIYLTFNSKVLLQIATTCFITKSLEHIRGLAHRIDINRLAIRIGFLI